VLRRWLPPAELSSFVGRRRELIEIAGLVARARLLTLTGVGGVGKTRLALRAASQLRRSFADRIGFVEVAPLMEPSLIGVVIAQALGLSDQSGRGALREVADHIGRQRWLLIVDNCEHVPVACAAALAELLRACPELRVLATSREPLRIEGEAVYRVPPLSLPPEEPAEPGALLGAEAVCLFVERARAALPSFELDAASSPAVADLCRRLDGIPLAIELAAAQLRALSVDQISDRLESRLDLPGVSVRDRPDRHATMRAAMDWSYGLLTEPERVLLRRLEVFTGGFDLEAAEAVCCGPPLAREHVLDALVGLVDRSLVSMDTAGRPRYQLLETVRHYGGERLRDSGEEAWVRSRHVEWCVQLACSVRSEWWGPRQREVLDRLRAEEGNVRAALELCVREPCQAERGLAICSGAWFIWHVRGRSTEGRRWMTALLQADRRQTRERAEALVGLGTLLHQQNDAKAAEIVLERAVELTRALGDRRTLALALARLGAAAAGQSDLVRAASLADEAVRSARESSDDAALANALSVSARIAVGQKTPARAAALYEECISLCALAGERWLRQRASLAMGVVRSEMGNHAEARELIRQSLAMARDLDDRGLMAWSIEGLAWANAAEGLAWGAATLLGAAQAVRDVPTTGYAADSERRERCRSVAVARLGVPAFEKAYAHGRRMSRTQAVAHALGDESALEPTPARPVAWPLSRREAEIAGLVAEGLSNRDIADRLLISVRTVENHMNHVFVKLGLSSRWQLARWFADLDRPA
jgi:non-specific serine/threonine protein kinase